MSKNISIVFLYSEIGPYNIPVFNELVKQYGVSLHVVRWDRNCLKPYSPPKLDGVNFYNRSEFDQLSLNELLNGISPDLIYVSGWMDKLYLKCALPFRLKGIPIVAGFDDIWVGSLRQRLGKYYFRMFLRKYFSHAWVAGSYQYEFARRLGFDRNQIIFDLLCADSYTFQSFKYNELSTSFLYVGNFRAVKGTDILLEGFKYYRNELGGSYDLLCVGNGELKAILDDVEGIEVLDYMEQKKLVSCIQNCVAFVLPSVHDQWGVVVHEFATAGMPLILSSGVGASSEFLIPTFNGYRFKRNDYIDLAYKMRAFESLSSTGKSMMSFRSKDLSKRITPESSAANLMSVLP